MASESFWGGQPATRIKAAKAGSMVAADASTKCAMCEGSVGRQGRRMYLLGGNYKGARGTPGIYVEAERMSSHVAVHKFV